MEEMLSRVLCITKVCKFNLKSLPPGLRLGKSNTSWLFAMQKVCQAKGPYCYIPIFYGKYTILPNYPWNKDL